MTVRDLSRLLRPKSVAVIGGGAWCRAVVEQLQKGGFGGEIWPVHPKATEICGLRAYDGVPSLPGPPDAAFVGINRDATVGAVERLRRAGAGGAVCFASGFAEVADGSARNAALLAAAGDMPIVGPNCYGVINALDGALLWPDQHGCLPVTQGVAILTQSSNIAINLTMQARGLPIGYMITTGNQAQISQADVAMSLLNDPRVTAIGLHVEGFGDVEGWRQLALAARAKGVSIVVLKVGQSAEAQAATVSHTASLAGSDAGAQAVLGRLGLPAVPDLASFVEALKLLHLAGPLASPDIASISCSGGEASLMADLAAAEGVRFPPLAEAQTTALAAALGPKVALANPLDYHTYIWRDAAAMTQAFAAMADPRVQLTCLIVDFPRADRCSREDWDCAIDAALQTRAITGRPVAMIATLPELMPEDVAARLMAGGVVPMGGLSESIRAIAAAVMREAHDIALPALPPGAAPEDAILMHEAAAKEALEAHGLPCPAGFEVAARDLAKATGQMSPPYVLKAIGLAHKSDSNAVALGLGSTQAVVAEADRMPGDRFLIEEMVSDGVTELLIGVVRDPAHGYVLTIAAGGILTEVMDDAVSALVPVTEACVRQMLRRLRLWPVLKGFRGRAGVDLASVVGAVMAIQEYVMAASDGLVEVEVNPLICTPDRAVAVDALIRRGQ